MIAVSLAAALVLTGCGSSGGGEVFASAGTGSSTGGSGSSGGGTGSTGMGLTGGTVPTTGGGGGTGGGSSTTGTGTTDGGSTDGGGDDGGTTDGGGGDPVSLFNRSVSLETSTPPAAGTFNPTQIVRIGNRVFYLDGFILGQDNGRLMSFTVNSTASGTTFSTPGPITAAGGSTESSSLDNPFGLATNGTDLFISVGYNIATDGAILKVSNITGNTGTFERLTLDVTPGAIPLNPLFLFTADVDGNEYVYWSEYSALASGGRVRRVRSDGGGPVQEVLNQLNFPAGIATDGVNLVVCDNLGGTGGQVVKAPLSFTGGAPRTPSTGGAVVVSRFGSEQNIQRPFDVAYDGATGFVFTEGNAIVPPSGTSPGPLGTGGAVRYLASSSTTARLIANGLNNPSGVRAVRLNSNNVGVTFVESVFLNGTLKRTVFNPGAPTLATAATLATGLDLPLSTFIFSSTTPEFLISVNYSGGSPTGRISSYRP